MKPRRPKSYEAPSLYDIVKAELLRGHPIESPFGSEVRLWPDVHLGSKESRDREDGLKSLNAEFKDLALELHPVGLKGTALPFVEAICGASVFEIDDSALVTALAMRPEMMANPRWSLPDLALVPHALTWLEYDPRVKVPDYDPELTSKRVGHLIIREADGGANVTTFELAADGKTALVNPYAFAWDSGETWERYKAVVGQHLARQGVTYETLSPMKQAEALLLAISGWTWSHRARGTSRLENDCRWKVQSELLTGRDALPWWGPRLNGILHGPVDLRSKDRGQGIEWRHVEPYFGGILEQSRSSASLLMALLALVAWCPQGAWVVGRPSGRFWHKARHRPYAARTRVVVRIPLREVKKYLKAGAAVMHKRRHSVREHFRKLRTGEIVRVREHWRGDASLGTVSHDYNVRGGGGGGFPGS